MLLNSKQIDLSKDLVFNGGNILLANGRILVGSGTSSNPSISFTDDSSTGLFLSEPGEISLSAGANAFVYLKSDGTVEMTGTSGIAIQAGSTAQRPQNPLPGLLRYNLTTSRFEAFIDNVWQTFSLTTELADYLRRDGSLAMTGTLNMSSQNIINAGTVNGVNVAAHAARHLPNGADALTTAPAVGLTLSSTNTAGTANSFARSDHTHQITGVQPLDSDLTALADLSTTGIITRTGNGTATTRTIVGTSNQIVVTNGDGISGNPTLTLSPTGVTPGTYETVVVDQFGRVTSASTPHPIYVQSTDPTTTETVPDGAIWFKI